ncbi:MAG TPA: type II toxin-antitoxin system ParD family antitoxin [Caulobacteraceae bacterium]|nr:type II toxin-antitoxin system ParD family antitoxin [Caulobacteraceae bacterium]
MNISLTPEFERRIAAKVDSGLYSTASEVVRDALRRLFEPDQEHERLLAGFNAELDEASASLDRGEGIDGEMVFEELDRLIESKASKRAHG